MPDIAVGSLIQAADFPSSKYAQDTTSLANLSNTTFLQGSPVVSVTFIAPTSGAVLLSVGCSFRDNTGTNRVHLAPLVRETDASGALVLAADVTTRGVGSPGATANFMYRSRTTILTGLTPGQQYYAHTAHKVSGGATADLQVRDITVTPLPLGGDSAGRLVKAVDFPAAAWNQDTTAINNPTNTSYALGTPEVSVTFRGPTSGRVLLIVGGGLGNSATADRIFLSPQVRLTDSSGAVILSPSVTSYGFASDNQSNAFHYGSRESVLEGLIPGQLYWAAVMYTVATDAGAQTADIAARDIGVVPIP